jgi:preprotein translocase subunit Sss1
MGEHTNGIGLTLLGVLGYLAVLDIVFNYAREVLKFL